MQAALNATAAGGTVFLAQKAVVRLTSTLTIPSGVTLATNGTPTPVRYAQMGRLVRAGSGALVNISPGGKLTSVWVDGQRNAANVPNYSLADINVSTLSGDGTTVLNNRIGNTRGFTNLRVNGKQELGGLLCSNNVISGNLIEAYSSDHYLKQNNNGLWADGISVSCESSVVSNNSVIDATDVGIVLFSISTDPQKSNVTNNTVLNAGNSAYAAYAADPVYNQGGVGNFANQASKSFVGASIQDNILWTSSRVHFDIGLAVGTRAWFGNQSYNSTGGSFINNSTGTQQARVGSGIVVSGALNVTVSGNSFSLFSPLATEATCPKHFVAASTSAGFASGSIQPPRDDVLYSGCIAH